MNKRAYQLAAAIISELTNKYAAGMWQPTTSHATIEEATRRLLAMLPTYVPCTFGMAQDIVLRVARFFHPHSEPNTEFLKDTLARYEV